MKGNATVIQQLNIALADEYTAIHQYEQHLGIAQNWGYNKFVEYIAKRISCEREHVKNLIERILFLEGTPIADDLNAVKVGTDLPTGLANDLASELTANAKYTAAIQACEGVGDFVTRDILLENMKDEQDHVKDIEAFLAQIKQTGVQNFLSTQV